MLKDELDLKPDEIQQLTYHLCFTFCRSTQSVSIVPAVVYAELLSQRGRAFLSARGTAREHMRDGENPYGSSCPLKITSDVPVIDRDLRRVLFFV